MEASTHSHQPLDELKLELDEPTLPRDRTTALRFRVVGADGRAVQNFDVEHDKRMHLIVIRRDLTGFQHLHPELGDDGEWTTDVTLPEAGSYRVFADFRREGQSHTLAGDLAVEGEADYRTLPEPTATADTGDGYQVSLDGEDSRAGEETQLAFAVTRRGEEVTPDDYLGAKGHLVALREGDLAYLHVHPAGGGHGHHDHKHEHEDATQDKEGAGEPIRFMTAFPSEGRYGLFLQFKHEGRAHTAAFTREVSR